LKEFRDPPLAVIRKLPRNGKARSINYENSEGRKFTQSLMDWVFCLWRAERIELMIQIYTGNGKGKTTAAIGLALRALGHGMNVCIVQFFKIKNYYGEQKNFKKFKNLKFYSFAQKHPHFYKNIKTKDIKNECEKAVLIISRIIKEKKCDLLILDELNIAIRDGYIDVEKIVDLLKNKPKKMEVIITGRSANIKILKLADLITNMLLVKHPYYKGIKSRKGIDY